MKTLILALLLSPLVFGQDLIEEGQLKLPPRFVADISSATVRPHMIPSLKTRAEALNRRVDELDAEEKAFRKRFPKGLMLRREVIDSNGEKKSKMVKSNNFYERSYIKRVQALGAEVLAFHKEVLNEYRIKQKQVAAVEKSKRAAELKQQAHADATAVTVTPATPEKTATTPSAQPAPSSVPGLPPGVEPTKKAPAALPLGMTKGR